MLVNLHATPEGATMPLVKLAAWRQNQRLTFQHHRIAHRAVGFKGDPAARMVNRRDGHLGIDQIAGAHGGHELQGLAQINRAMAGQLFADHR